jgi:hypothetical protein
MNKFKKLLTVAALSSASLFASANSIQLDAFTDYDSDGNSLSAFFDVFTFNIITPTSAYIDLEGDGIEQGNLVFDSAFNVTVGALNPLTTDNEALNVNFPGLIQGYQLVANYELAGFAGFNDTDSSGFHDDGEQLTAGFFGGYFDLNLVDIATGSSIDVLDLNITGSQFQLGGTGLSFDLFAEIDSVADNFINFSTAYFGSTDLHDIITNPNKGSTQVVATTEIANADTAPTENGTYTTTTFQNNVLASLGMSLDQNSKIYTRETELTSTNLRINVTEPTTVAILGLALVGFGLSSRKKKQA